MKSFFKNILSTVLGFVLSFIILIILSIGIISIAITSLDNESNENIKQGSILKINLSNPIVEQASENPFESLSLNNFSPEIKIELRDILDNIEKAKNDERIKGIYLTCSSINAGLSQTEEIRNKLLDFKSSGKFIISYAENYTQKGYYLSSIADEIYLNPEGIVELKGFSASIMFFKGLLEKLDIKVQVIRHGKFKSAIEPFVLNKMSAENRKQMSLLINTIADNVLDSIASQRGLSLKKIEEITNTLDCNTATKCIEYNFIDELLYEDQVIHKLKNNLVDTNNINLVSLQKYRNVLLKKKEKISRDKIAIIYTTGEISSGKGDLESIGSETTVKAIRKASKDKRIKAIVLRINSPGGSAIASDVILREIMLAKLKKPIVVSMGDVAASGGYYIACAADSIVANPTTITGSIGVFGLIPNMQNFYRNKLGITIDTVNTHKYADMGMNRPLTDFEANKIQESVKKIYKTFIEHVSVGRNISIAAVDEIGQGRVWTGYDAKRLGLVDVLGGLEKAIEIASYLAKIDNYRLISLPEKEDPFETMIKGIKGEETIAITNYLGIDPKYVKTAETLIHGERIKTRIPFILEVN
jgi:protease-4